MEQYRYFFDMDGTLFKWNDIPYYERLYEEGYFRNLEPNMDLINVVNSMLEISPDEVFISSKYLDDSKYAKDEKIAALKEYMPNLEQENIILIPNNSQKINYIPNGVGMFDILIDDYTNNLLEWEQAGGVGIKYMNGINHTKGSWQGLKTPTDTQNEFTAEDLLILIKNASKYKMSQEDYLIYKGVSSPISDFLTDKLRGNRLLRTQRGQDKFEKEAMAANNAYHDKREGAKKEYKELVVKGLLRPKSNIEKSLENAHGHEDLAATHAARRLLAKRGIDWKTGEKLNEEKAGENRMNEIKKENSEVLSFFGEDFWGRPIFKVGDTGAYVKDINLGNGELSLYWSCPKNDPDGEPDYPFKINKEIVLVNYNPVSAEDKFNYMMLGRLQSDCEYYLGFGNQSPRSLVGENEEQHIERMKEIYLSFSEDKKPKWITMDMIEEYERQMCTNQDENTGRTR